MLRRAAPCPCRAAGIVDLSGMLPVDSAAVAVLLALERGRARRRQAARSSGRPRVLAALADLYGVDDLFAA